MKFLEKLAPNEASRFYITGIILSVVALFIMTGVVFLMLVANKLNIIMSQPAGDTYTYFMVVMDRILAVLTVFVVIPMTIFQISAKNKFKIDETVSFIAVGILIAFICTFLSGEYFFFKKYSEGKLNNSKMFCGDMIEKKIFNQIIISRGSTPPQTCVIPSDK